MAVNTKAHRFSMMNFGEGDALLPYPDSDIDQGDRQHLLGLFAEPLALLLREGMEAIVSAVPVLSGVASNVGTVLKGVVRNPS